MSCPSLTVLKANGRLSARSLFEVPQRANRSLLSLTNEMMSNQSSVGSVGDSRSAVGSAVGEPFAFIFEALEVRRNVSNRHTQNFGMVVTVVGLNRACGQRLSCLDCGHVS
jgi:tryptophanase